MNIARYLLLHLKTLRGMTVVHVGAHLGQEAGLYQNMLARKVVWIEASPQTFELLKENIAKAEAEPSYIARCLFAKKTEHICINALISDDNQQQLDFHVFSNAGASNSVFKLNRENRKYDAICETGEVLRLPVKTLDQALSEAGVEPSEVDVLVLDTQGAELLCLKGASRVLASAKYIDAEVSTIPVYTGGVLLPELEAWLEERGFFRKTSVRRTHMNAIFRKAG